MIQKIIIGVLVFLTLTAGAFAQNLSIKDFNKLNDGVASELVIKMYPKYPASDEETTVRINSYYFDINASEVVVYVNGKEYKRQVGLKEFKFVTAKPGKKNLIQILVRDPKGKIHNKKIDFTSENVSLIYEINNPYKPFGYEGKSTILSNSELTVFAFPDFISSNGKKIDKKSLIYTWYVNEEVDVNASGFGKYKYYINRLTAMPSDMYLSVVVTDVSKNKIAKNEIYFKPKNTKVDFYIFDKSLPFSFKNVSEDGSIKTKKKDFILLAAPYFMNISDASLYSWKINDRNFVHDLGANKLELPLLNDSKNKNTIVDINFELKNRDRILQTASKKVRLILESQSNSGIPDREYFNEGKNSDGSSFFGI